MRLNSFPTIKTTKIQPVKKTRLKFSNHMRYRCIRACKGDRRKTIWILYDMFFYDISSVSTYLWIHALLDTGDLVYNTHMHTHPGTGEYIGSQFRSLQRAYGRRLYTLYFVKINLHTYYVYYTIYMCSV